MVAKRELSWWLELIQTDPTKIQERVKLRLMNELENRINNPFDCAAYKNPRITPDQFELLLVRLKEEFDDLMDGGTISSSYTVHESLSFARGEAETWTNTRPLFDVCLALFIRSIRESEVQQSDFMKCFECGGFFIQQTGRPKMYCSKPCRNKGAEKARRVETHKQKEKSRNGSNTEES